MSWRGVFSEKPTVAQKLIQFLVFWHKKHPMNLKPQQHYPKLGILNSSNQTKNLVEDDKPS